MIHAYQETFLDKVMSLMGEAFDYAINDCNLSGQDFVKIFTASPICTRIENGEPAVISGKSGIEIVRECIFSVTGKEITDTPINKFGRTPEYWSGWALAYYQCTSGRRYAQIFQAIAFNDLLRMYPTLHEADITKFADIMNKRMRDIFPDTNLKRIRTIYGCTQSELAELSGVSLRSIQMYEQRQKDINRASVEAVSRIAKVLGCSVEDLIER